MSLEHREPIRSAEQDKRNRLNQQRFGSAMDAVAEVRKIENLLMNATNLSGTFYPEDRSHSGFALYKIKPEMEALTLADRLPPNSLRHYYGYRDGAYHDELYLKSGANDVAAMRRILAADGFDPMGQPILDFGCAAGRLIRHFEAEAREADVWGVDLHSAAIHWAQAHLSPPFHFMMNTTSPHLPFEDNSFGFIFAGSVWTHIGELDDAWLLEMRRILRPGGRLYLTISDQDTLAEVARQKPDHPSNAHVAELDDATGMLSQDWVAFVTRTTPWLQRVVYNREAWLARIGAWLEVRQAVPGAYGWQTGVLLSKREGRR